MSRCTSSPLILDHEGVVVVETRALIGKEQAREGQQARLLQIVEQRLETNLVDDEPVTVHRVRAAHGQAARLVVRQLLEKQRAEAARDHLEAEDELGDLHVQNG